MGRVIPIRGARGAPAVASAGPAFGHRWGAGAGVSPDCFPCGAAMPSPNSLAARSGQTQGQLRAGFGTFKASIEQAPRRLRASSWVQSSSGQAPSDSKQTLGIKLPFLVMIIKNLKKYFSFEVQVCS